MTKTLITLVLIFLEMTIATQPVSAQGPTIPTPPPVTTPPPVNPIDQANADAAQWQSVANQAMASAQTSINAAYGALAAAQASVYQYQAAYQQAEAARQAAVRGQLQAASDLAHAAQVSSVQAIGLAGEASRSAMSSIHEASLALNQVPALQASLTAVIGQRNSARSEAAQAESDRAALAGALVAERARSDLFGKVALGALLLLGLTLLYIAVVLWKLMRALRIKQSDRLVVLDERGRVKAQIEATR